VAGWVAALASAAQQRLGGLDASTRRSYYRWFGGHINTVGTR
jgi:hypothetical protein